MSVKTYRFLGIDTAMHLLRPGAKWEISNNVFTRWDDPRPCPTIEEVYETIEKIRQFSRVMFWLLPNRVLPLEFNNTIPELPE